MGLWPSHGGSDQWGPSPMRSDCSLLKATIAAPTEVSVDAAVVASARLWLNWRVFLRWKRSEEEQHCEMLFALFRFVQVPALFQAQGQLPRWFCVANHPVHQVSATVPGPLQGLTVGLGVWRWGGGSSI